MTQTIETLKLRFTNLVYTYVIFERTGEKQLNELHNRKMELAGQLILLGMTKKEIYELEMASVVKGFEIKLDLAKATLAA